jgi:four helix bundle protein
MPKSTDLIERLHQFSLCSITFYRRLPKTPDAQVPGVQFLRSSTSMCANYRAARRGRSRAEFIAKLGQATEEADESVGWLELMRGSQIADDPALLAEAKELCAILTASLTTARGNIRAK